MRVRREFPVWDVAGVIIVLTGFMWIVFSIAIIFVDYSNMNNACTNLGLEYVNSNNEQVECCNNTHLILYDRQGDLIVKNSEKPILAVGDEL